MSASSTLPRVSTKQAARSCWDWAKPAQEPGRQEVEKQVSRGEMDDPVLK
jgi:hypothetical protein